MVCVVWNFGCSVKAESRWSIHIHHPSVHIRVCLASCLSFNARQGVETSSIWCGWVLLCACGHMLPFEQRSPQRWTPRLLAHQKTRTPRPCLGNGSSSAPRASQISTRRSAPHWAMCWKASTKKWSRDWNVCHRHGRGQDPLLWQRQRTRSIEKSLCPVVCLEFMSLFCLFGGFCLLRVFCSVSASASVSVSVCLRVCWVGCVLCVLDSLGHGPW